MSPTDVPTVVAVPAATEELVTASKKERAKTLVKKTFTRVGVPVLIGTAAAFVVSRRSNDNETSDETVTIDE